MQRRTLVNLVLAAVLAVLGALAWWQPGLPTAEATRLVDAFDIAGIDRLTIRRAVGETMVLRKTERGWWLDVPLRAPVDNARVAGLLAIIDAPSVSAFDTGNLSLASFGLAPPRLAVSFEAKSGAILELGFGDTESLSGRRYMLAGGRVHLTADNYYYQFDTTATGFVDHHVLPAGTRLTRFESEALVLEERQGHWQLVKGPEAASADAIQQFLDAWRSAQALSVSPIRSRDGGMAVRLVTGDGELEFTRYIDQDELVLVRDDVGIEYHLPMQLAAGLLDLAAADDDPVAGAGSGSGDP